MRKLIVSHALLEERCGLGMSDYLPHDPGSVLALSATIVCH
jgi:hypothetical protein